MLNWKGKRALILPGDYEPPNSIMEIELLKIVL